MATTPIIRDHTSAPTALPTAGTRIATNPAPATVTVAARPVTLPANPTMPAVRVPSTPGAAAPMLPGRLPTFVPSRPSASPTLPIQAISRPSAISGKAEAALDALKGKVKIPVGVEKKTAIPPGLIKQGGLPPGLAKQGLVMTQVLIPPGLVEKFSLQATLPAGAKPGTTPAGFERRRMMLPGNFPRINVMAPPPPRATPAPLKPAVKPPTVVLVKKSMAAVPMVAQGTVHPQGTVARWNEKEKAWWLFYPKALSGYDLGADEIPDAKEPGTAAAAPTGAQPGAPVAAPFYKQTWFWIASGAAVLAAGGATAFVLVRRKRA